MRLGLIGPGRWGSNYLKPENGDRVSAVLHAKGNWKPLGFDGLQTNFWDGFLSEVDACIIATPPHLHPEHILRCFEAGKDVLCEKPLALTRCEWAMLLNEASKRGRRLGIAYQHLFSERLVQATGEQSEWVECEMFGNSGHHEYSPLLDWGSHAVAIAISALGKLGMPASIRATGPRRYEVRLGDAQAVLQFGHSETEKKCRFVFALEDEKEHVYESGQDRIPPLKVMTERFATNRSAAIESLDFHDDVARILFG